MNHFLLQISLGIITIEILDGEPMVRGGKSAKNPEISAFSARFLLPLMGLGGINRPAAGGFRGLGTSLSRFEAGEKRSGLGHSSR